MRWAEFRGPGLANRLQTAIFGDSSGICKTRIQQQQTAAAEFGTFLLKTAMAHMEIRNRDEKTAVGMNLRSHSLDKLRQIVTVRPAHPRLDPVDGCRDYCTSSRGPPRGRHSQPSASHHSATKQEAAPWGMRALLSTAAIAAAALGVACPVLGVTPAQGAPSHLLRWAPHTSSHYILLCLPICLPASARLCPPLVAYLATAAATAAPAAVLGVRRSSRGQTPAVQAGSPAPCATMATAP
jgi:hypothetical protein